MQKRWLIKDQNPALQVMLSNGLDIHPTIAQLLVNRDVTTIKEAKSFLFPSLSGLHDPFLLKDMDKAVERIKKAAKNKEVVLIFGDYDVDGVTSSVILRKSLEQIGIEVTNYIPHRLQEGYGLNHNIIDLAKEKNIRLLIAIDCGITAFGPVEALNQAGIDVLIFDHHEPPEGKLPNAYAIVNPKRKDCPYPFNGLASVGLAFKLSQALLGKDLPEILDLVAIGTIADVAELNGENRIFVKEGLKKISSTKNLGLLALMDVARIKGKKLKPSSVGFILGPRLNAAGRLDSADTALKLLLCEDVYEAYKIAKILEGHNQNRQKTQSGVVEEALSIIEREVNFKDHRIIVLSKEGWHRGVVGIVASRIAEMYYRPTIVISLEEETGVGSARSIDGFHIFEALMNSSRFLENFGGHKHAAGLTIKRENIEAFRESINEFAQTALDVDQLIPMLEIDCEVPLSNLSNNLVKLVELLEPYGEGNPAPLFCTRRLKVKSPPVVLGKDTIKFWVTDGQIVVQAVGFGMGKYLDLVKSAEEIDVVYSLAIDDWNKEPIVSLQLKDIKES